MSQERIDRPFEPFDSVDPRAQRTPRDLQEEQVAQPSFLDGVHELD
jgi:hypothetical protein